MATTTPPRARQARESVVIRFAGDSGDGMQVTGSRFTVEAALAGNDLTTFPDFPAEIRAPAGTTYGVSAFQIHFGGVDVTTPGDEVDVLVAMNPAALKVDLKDLRRGGTIVVDTGAFSDRNLAKAGFPANPIEDGSLAQYQVLTVDITRLTAEAVKDLGLSTREAHRCRNMWALGLMLWMYGRDVGAPRGLYGGEGTGRAGTLPRRQWHGGDRLGIDRRHARGGASEDDLCGLPDHARLPAAPHAGEPQGARRDHVPGRGRDRRDRRRDRRRLRGSARRDVELRPRDGAQDRNARPRDRHRASARGGQLAARRSLHRHAYQSRAVRSVPGRARAQCGRAARGDRPGDGKRLFRGRDRSGADRHEVHDAGDPAFGRVPGSCGRTVAPPRPVGAPPVPGPFPHRPRRLPPVRPRPGDPGARVGRARHIRPRAPHRRAREGLRYGAHFLRSGKPRPDDPHPGSEDRRDRARHPNATGGAGRRPRRRRRGGLGLDVRRDSASGPRRAGGRGRRLAPPPSLSEPVPVEPGRPAQALRPCARAGDEYWTARAALAGGLPRARGGVEQSGRETVQSGGDRASDSVQEV